MCLKSGGPPLEVIYSGIQGVVVRWLDGKTTILPITTLRPFAERKPGLKLI
jgi:hypothetical protein